MSKNCNRILIVDDDKDACELLSHLIKKESHEVHIAHDGTMAMRLVTTIAPDVILLDIKMPGINGTEVLKRTIKLDSNLPIIIITAYANIDGAVSAMKEGAYDYISKPFDNKDLIRVVNQAINKRRVMLKNKDLSEKNYDLKEMMGHSNAISQLIHEVNCVAQSNLSVLILGETGTGKELVAYAIHQNSPRLKSNFIPVDCGAITETLWESELFGYEKGAFTDAKHQTIGKIESVNGGTLFLDEISNMPIASQSVLLRVLQDKNIFRIGSTKPVHVDVRIITASNQNLEKAIKTESFRQDLFFRLNEFTIKIPSLRERKEDILYLAKRFLNSMNMELNKKIKGFSESASEALLSYDWPGNVRELKSTIRRAVLLADEMITSKHLNIRIQPIIDIELTSKIHNILNDGLSLKKIVKGITCVAEQKLLLQVIKNTEGNKAEAARLLKVDYKTIHTKLKKYGIVFRREI